MRILTWGGLRGGVSVALALSIPAQLGGMPVPERDMVLVTSIALQGLTVGSLVRRAVPKAAEEEQQQVTRTAA